MLRHNFDLATDFDFVFKLPFLGTPPIFASQ